MKTEEEETRVDEQTVTPPERATAADLWALQPVKAEAIARVLHATQLTKYDDRPYIEHVERVAGRVIGVEAKAAAWLHDVVEDAMPSLAHGMLALEAAGFSQVVLSSVWLLTRAGEYRDYEPCLARLERSGNAVAIAVKIADLTDNLRPSCPPASRTKYEAALRRMLDAKQAVDAVARSASK